jgi:cephalosporin hydroxylase
MTTGHEPRHAATAPATPKVPAPIEVDLHAPLRDHWRKRLERNQDWYAGTPILKYPESLRIYEHLLWLSKPDVVIELGVWQGASSLWFRDALLRLTRYGGASSPRVVAVDVDVSIARRGISAADPAWEDSIDLVQADVCDPSTPERVERLLAPGARCMVVEDSAHTLDTTLASLRGFARLVAPKGFFVVEDGVVDVEELRLDGYPRGVMPAIRRWLRSEQGAEFIPRPDLDVYGISNFTGGILQRAGAPDG